MSTPIAKKYRLKFMPIFKTMAIGTGLPLLILSLIATGFDTRLIQVIVVVGVIFPFTWSLLWTTILTLFFRITISESGIRGYNFWGKYRFVEWEKIKECRIIDFIGLKFLRVFTQDNKLPLWIPMFLNNMQGFRENIINLTNQSNCLRSYFKTQQV